jgi:peptidoglycan hydrolase-like protein with peptidoglycan-binding domain
MQASIAFDDNPRPPRRGVARALLRAILRRPAASLGCCLAFAFTAAVAVNALYLQSGPHPAPRIAGVPAGSPKETTGSLVAPSASPAKAHAPTTEAPSQRPRAQVITAIQQELASRGFYDGAIDGIYGPKMDAGIRDFEQAAGLRVSGDPSEALLEAIGRSKLQAARRTSPAVPATSAATGRQQARPVPSPPSRRVIAVQRALSDFGYGQLRLTGLFDEATKAAIEKFERERKLPVRGQISDRLLRELAAVTGRPLE